MPSGQNNPIPGGFIQMKSLLSGMYSTRAAKVNRQMCCSGGREADKTDKAAEDGKCYKDNIK